VYRLLLSIILAGPIVLIIILPAITLIFLTCYRVSVPLEYAGGGETPMLSADKETALWVNNTNLQRNAYALLNQEESDTDV
jgi:hypothetical protein